MDLSYYFVLPWLKLHLFFFTHVASNLVELELCEQCVSPPHMYWLPMRNLLETNFNSFSTLLCIENHLSLISSVVIILWIYSVHQFAVHKQHFCKIPGLKCLKKTHFWQGFLKKNRKPFNLLVSETGWGKLA